ncbi:hypothetical protein GOP47_0004601, partial [Adiantum capillus-veneris]
PPARETVGREGCMTEWAAHQVKGAINVRPEAEREGGHIEGQLGSIREGTSPQGSRLACKGPPKACRRSPGRLKTTWDIEVEWRHKQKLKRATWALQSLSRQVVLHKRR